MIIAECSGTFKFIQIQFPHPFTTHSIPTRLKPERGYWICNKAATALHKLSSLY